MNVDEMLDWIEKAPHLAGCTAEFAPQLCSCGKNEMADSIQATIIDIK